MNIPSVWIDRQGDRHSEKLLVCGRSGGYHLNISVIWAWASRIRPGILKVFIYMISAGLIPLRGELDTQSSKVVCGLFELLADCQLGRADRRVCVQGAMCILIETREGSAPFLKTILFLLYFFSPFSPNYRGYVKKYLQTLFRGKVSRCNRPTGRQAGFHRPRQSGFGAGSQFFCPSPTTPTRFWLGKPGPTVRNWVLPGS